MAIDFLNFTDKDSTPIKLGDIVDVTKGKHKGAEMIFLFCIPQHRFGFCYKRRYDNMMETNAENGFGFNMFPEEFITMDADLSMYYTPARKSEIKLK